MAEEVQIISTLDNAQTLGALGQTEKAVNSNTEALEGATQASTELLKGIVKESKAAQKTLSELTASSEKLTEEIENTQRGTKRYAELKNELIGVNKEIKNVELSFEALDSEQVASEVGSVVGGMTDVATGAFLALGVAEDSAQEFFNTLAQVEGTGRIVKGSIEGIQSASKLYNNVIKQGNILQQANAATLGAVGVAQKAYTAAIGTSTGGLKLFKLALIGTGIGAIVVGLGLLIANFDAIKNAVSKAIDGFNDLGVVMKIILYPITLIVEAYNLMQKALIELGVIQSEEAKKAIAAAEERVASLAKEKDAIGEKFDFEISKARAAGKDTVELEKEKRKAVLENLKAQANAILALVKLSGEFNDEQREALQDISKQAKELSKESVVEEIKNTKKKADEAKKAAEEAKKLAEKRRAEELAAQKAQAEELNKIAQELVELKIASIEDETTRELALLDNKFDARINKLKTGGEEEIELAKALEIEKARQVAEVNDKAEADRIAKKKEAADLERENASLLAQTEIEIKQAKAQTEREELEAQKEADILAENEAFEQKLVNLQERGLLTQELEAEIETARQASLASIDAQFKIDKDAQDEEFKNREIARENKKRNDKIAIAATTAGALSSIAGSLDTLGVKSAGLSKTLAIAEIAVSTAKGVAGAVAAGSSIPFPGNIPAIITGVASVVSGIASAKKALSSAKVPGGGGGGSVSIPSVNIPGGSGASIAPSTPNLNLTPGSGGDSGGDTNEAGSNQVIKAFVVESEISDEQSNAKVIEEKSELN